MDFKLALFLQTYHGLKLNPEDQALVLDPQVPHGDPDFPSHLPLSSEAAQFLKAHPNWRQQARAVLEMSEERGVKWTYWGQADYPSTWKHLSKPPLLFNYMGEAVWSQIPLLAVVGSRTPLVDTSLWLQRELAAFLQRYRVGVVSGGARGVDQLAHRLSLACGRPTVVVFPSGVLNRYPPMREELWDQVLQAGGALLSPYPLHEPMRKSAFHFRNRWIAGLSPLTFVAEANRRSGSSLTAQFAAAENRTVCTVPVSVNSAQGLGNLDLLISGAQMIRDAEDLSVVWGQSFNSTLFEWCSGQSSRTES